MFRRLTMFLAIVGTSAVVVPASASATTGLTEGGTLIPAGKILTATNVGAVKVTSSKTGTISCSTVMLEGKVSVNTTSLVEGTEGGINSVSNCTTATGAALSVRNLRANILKSTGGGTATIGKTFEVVFSGGLVCKYKGTFAATYNTSETGAGGNVFTITKQPLSAEPAACGTSAEFDAVFKLSTQGSSTFNVFLM